MFTVCFFGSSNDSFSKKYKEDVESFLEILLSEAKKQKKDIRIINGGYAGLMKLISEVAKKKSKEKEISLEVIGILYSCYNEAPNEYNDKIITCDSLGQRIQVMIDMSDIFVAFPGESGTFHEIHHLLEELKYPNSINDGLGTTKPFLVHSHWNKKLEQKNGLKYFDFDDSINFNSQIINLISTATTKKIYFSFTSNNNKESIEEGIKKLAKEIDTLIVGKKLASESTNILGLDIAYSYFIDDEKIFGKNYSFSTSKYREMLSGFFVKYNSLLFSNIVKEDSYIKTYDELDNKILQVKNEDLSLNSEVLEIVSNKEESNFKDWCLSLERNGVGKLSLWFNQKIEYDNKPINLSSFLVLDTILSPSMIERIFYLVESFLLNNVIGTVIDNKTGLFLLGEVSKSGNLDPKSFIPDKCAIQENKQNSITLKQLTGCYDKHLTNQNSTALKHLLADACKDYEHLVRMYFEEDKIKSAFYPRYSSYTEVGKLQHKRDPFFRFLYGRLMILILHLENHFTYEYSYKLLTCTFSDNKRSEPKEIQKSFLIKGFFEKGTNTPQKTSDGKKLEIANDVELFKPHLSKQEKKFLTFYAKDKEKYL